VSGVRNAALAIIRHADQATRKARENVRDPRAETIENPHRKNSLNGPDYGRHQGIEDQDHAKALVRCMHETVAQRGVAKPNRRPIIWLTVLGAFPASIIAETLLHQTRVATVTVTTLSSREFDQDIRTEFAQNAPYCCRG
jgi:hypothetical protein